MDQDYQVLYGMIGGGTPRYLLPGLSHPYKGVCTSRTKMPGRVNFGRPFFRLVSITAV